MKVAPPSINRSTCSVCDNPETIVSVIGYILGSEIVMSKSSSDKGSESKRTRPDPANHHHTANAEEQSDYYYDDSTGYEIYQDKDDEEETTED